MSEHLVVDIALGVGTIVFNRPEKLNAVSAEMAEALVGIAQKLERDPEVRCVLIRGEGPSFCSGGDIGGFHESLAADRFGHANRMEQRVVNGHLTFHRLRRMAKPVIVATHGNTAGMGISLMCCADLVIAADDSQYTLAYRHIGLSLDGGVSFFLPRIVGERRALEMALLGERFDAARAAEWGLVNRVVPAADLTAEAEKLARRLAAGPTRALGEIKRLIRRSFQSSWDEQSAAEAFAIAETVATDDHLEGVSAFVEKRRATFTGR